MREVASGSGLWQSPASQGALSVYFHPDGTLLVVAAITRPSTSSMDLMEDWSPPRGKAIATFASGTVGHGLEAGLVTQPSAFDMCFPSVPGGASAQESE